ncbi:hypothetical protein ACDA63_18115 [Uliginosibacterium sp. sgz301328]|uniref:hypothetical protein n=1 Tax=Uliginosibacterium sp. sgz301328 TaxID=3243764 RepID=UPI00359E6652
MQSSELYKGFLVEPLVYQVKDTALRAIGVLPSRMYQASVRITDVKAAKSSVSKLPPRPDFNCIGDARRAAERFGRDLVDRLPAEAEREVS